MVLAKRQAILSALLSIILVVSLTVQAQNPSVVIHVDVNAGRRPINPDIYGIAHASPSIVSDLNVTLNRQGGNNTSRYNWQLNADNRANDWYYQSIPEPSATAGERGDTFITGNKAAGAESMLTIPMVGWVAKLGAGRSKLASFSIAKYGAQTGNDWQWFPDAGNGIWTNGQPVTGNDPNDANVFAPFSFQAGWIRASGTRRTATFTPTGQPWRRSAIRPSNMRLESRMWTRPLWSSARKSGGGAATC